MAVLEICTPIDQKKNNYQKYLLLFWVFLKINCSEIVKLTVSCDSLTHVGVCVCIDTLKNKPMVQGHTVLGKH
jgi:hypothetical protein